MVRDTNWNSNCGSLSTARRIALLFVSVSLPDLSVSHLTFVYIRICLRNVGKVLFGSTNVLLEAVVPCVVGAKRSVDVPFDEVVVEARDRSARQASLRSFALFAAVNKVAVACTSVCRQSVG